MRRMWLMWEIRKTGLYWLPCVLGSLRRLIEFLLGLKYVDLVMIRVSWLWYSPSVSWIINASCDYSSCFYLIASWQNLHPLVLYSFWPQINMGNIHVVWLNFTTYRYNCSSSSCVKHDEQILLDFPERLVAELYIFR